MWSRRLLQAPLAPFFVVGTFSDIAFNCGFKVGRREDAFGHRTVGTVLAPPPTSNSWFWLVYITDAAYVSEQGGFLHNREDVSIVF